MSGRASEQQDMQWLINDRGSCPINLVLPAVAAVAAVE